MSKAGTVFFLILFLSQLCPVVSAVQFDGATVLGTVKDSLGAVLAGATVYLKNIDTGISVSAQTDADGNYQFTNVKIGNYRISAENLAFATAIVEKVNVTVNSRQRVDLIMQPGSLTESVLVTAGAELLETESSGRGQVVQREQIVNLPLNWEGQSSKKDRTFFFVDYEGFRQISKTLVFSALPTIAQRDGILSVDVRDPFTGNDLSVTGYGHWPLRGLLPNSADFCARLSQDSHKNLGRQCLSSGHEQIR